MKEWCQDHKIEQRFTSVGYPQANGQTEATNKTIVANLQKRLTEERRCWVEQLDGVLWAYRTTARTSTQETPFGLVYGSESIIAAEIVVETIRIQGYSPADNHFSRIHDFDTLKTVRSDALARTMNYQSIMARSYNKDVQQRYLQVGDLVLRRADILKKVRKFQPNWARPI